MAKPVMSEKRTDGLQVLSGFGLSNLNLTT